MANPTLKTYSTDSEITYSRTESGGSVFARANLGVELSADNTVRLVRDGGRIHGELIEVFGDSTCSVQIDEEMTLKQGAANATAVNNPIVGGTGPSIGSQTNGYCKSAPSTAAGARAGRGVVTARPTNTDGAQVSVLMQG